MRREMVAVGAKKQKFISVVEGNVGRENGKSHGENCRESSSLSGEKLLQFV